MVLPPKKNRLRISSGILIFSLILFVAQSAFGQQDTTKRPSGTHVVFSLDSRSTIIDREHITINGAWTGIEFGKIHHKFTVGYYWLKYGASQKIIDLHKKLAEIINLSSYTKTDVFFVSLGYWYPLIHNQKWILSIPVELGIGKETANYHRVTDDSGVGKSNTVFSPVQGGIYGEFHATKWAGLFSQVGYRNTFSSIGFRERFRGPYYSYGLTVYPDAFFKAFKARKNKSRTK